MQQIRTINAIHNTKETRKNKNKMAASVLQRCFTAAVKVKSITPTFTARRCLLSAAYTDTTLWESREKDPQNLALLAASMDRTYERKLPVSSVTISRFIDNITSREEVEQAEYYLYKFRHSPNCWYLRNWTMHGWIRQCLKYGARDKALYTLKNKVQYGMFPDDFTFNLLIDSYIKEEDFKGACSVVEEVMLQEAFDLPSTQILSMYALSSYLATKPPLTVAEERMLGAALLIAGLKQNNTVGLSAQLLGNSLLGKLEMTKGINAVFKGMPLIWTNGYLGRALAVMERVAATPGDIRLSQDTLDTLNSWLQELSSVSESDSSSGDSSSGDEESGGEEERQEEAKLDADDEEERMKLPLYVSRFKELCGQLESQGKVDPASLHALVSATARQALATAEQPDLDQYQSRLQDWEVERRHLMQREKEFMQMAEEVRRKRTAEKLQKASEGGHH